MLTIKRGGCIVAALATVIFSFSISQALAEELRAADIVRDLAPTPPQLTRSLSTSKPASPDQTADEAFVNTLRERGTRSLSVGEMAKLDEIVDNRKNKNFEMRFAYNSNVLSGKDLEIAKELGKALSDPALKEQTFLIMGHTDAKGSDASNQRLSERRAAWVKNYLVTTYKIPSERLVPVGYGETHLLNAEAPNAAENRRVQVVNVMAYKAAKN